MISCMEFIHAYSELFRFLHERYGRAAVGRFWEGISDRFLTNLRDHVGRKGMEGMYEYWTHTLTEERGDWEMELRCGGHRRLLKCHGDQPVAETRTGGEPWAEGPDAVFQIRMHACPSVAKLRRATHMKPYASYCEHCDALYRRVIEPFGYTYEIAYLDPDKGACRLTVKPKAP